MKIRDLRESDISISLRSFFLSKYLLPDGEVAEMTCSLFRHFPASKLPAALLAQLACLTYVDIFIENRTFSTFIASSGWQGSSS